MVGHRQMERQGDRETDRQTDVGDDRQSLDTQIKKRH